jgi:choline dehydrogenase
MLGGSSAVNGMIWVHGTPQEYDAWARKGCEGWSYADLIPYFQRIENYARGHGSSSRGQSGPIHVTEYGPRDALTEAFLDGVAATGQTRRVDDYNQECVGAGYVQFNTHRGRRWAVREGYLAPLRGAAALVIETGAFANRVLLQDGRATGVEYQVGSSTRRAIARREVILSAGSYGTPQLLELSGIGRREILAQHGIPLIHELRGVGENLSEHLYTGLPYQAREGTGWNRRLGIGWRAAIEGLKYFATRQGPLTTVTITGQAFVPTTPGGRAEMKVQLRQVTTKGTRNSTRTELGEQDGFEIGSFVISPRSRGSTHVASRDPRANPRLVANHLTTDYDVHTALQAIRIARDTAASSALASFRPQPMLPDLCDEKLLAHIRATGATAYHPVGTCSMGQDDSAVVSPDLKVRGLEGLRVADASVLPSLASSNTNAICMVVGERAADAILAEHG